MLNTIIQKLYKKTFIQAEQDKNNFERFIKIKRNLSLFDLYFKEKSLDENTLREFISTTLNDCKFVEENKKSILRFDRRKETKEAVEACINISQMLTDM